MKYKISRIPSRGKSGFSFTELNIIADNIIMAVNADNADLMLEKQHRKDCITRYTAYGLGRTREVVRIRPGYEDYVKPWATKTIQGFFAPEEHPDTIKIVIKDFKLEIVKSPYAIREILKRLDIIIEQI